MEENKQDAVRENLTTELLKTLIEQNKRMSRALITSIIVCFLIVASFLIYMAQYNFTSQIEQKGLYTFVDSEGNVISSDITPEEMKEILEIIGNNEDHQKPD